MKLVHRPVTDKIKAATFVGEKFLDEERLMEYLLRNASLD